jgi:hypothetical protein
MIKEYEDYKFEKPVFFFLWCSLLEFTSKFVAKFDAISSKSTTKKEILFSCLSEPAAL